MKDKSCHGGKGFLTRKGDNYMSWGGGKSIMIALINSLNRYDINDWTRKQVYKDIIKELKEHDFVNLYTCEGIDESYDKAVKELHPDVFK
jgi:hypothetical protein